ncbi:MAG: TetR/AcrR family transcriptional regulator [Rhodospirillales bacterium]|nr:TetR/AcrR family transcriptional regulator [Rhodospirillales bacterium]
MPDGSLEAADRISPSVVKILRGAVDAIAARGAKRLSMSDIIEASGVSRGTLYRYFSTKEDVLAAVMEFICVGYENGIRDAGAGIDDPVERLRQVMLFYGRYTEKHSRDRVFEVEPHFHLAFFRNRFVRYNAVLLDTLAPTFDHLDRLIGKPVDRYGFCETLVRLQLSTLLVPTDDNFRKRWEAAPDAIERWAVDLARQQC